MIKKILDQLGPAKLGVIIALALVTVTSILLFAYRFSSPSLAPLYTNLTFEDSFEVLEQLDTRNIPYEIRNNGAIILVASDKVLKLRMELAREGYPSGNSVVGYEIFDDPSALGTSSFIYDVNLRRALEGELSRTISSFELVEKARVHLNVPKKQLFKREKEETTASIVLTLRGNNSELSKGQVSAISHLVATAVPNLDPKNITIVDTEGIPFRLGAGDKDDPAYFANLSEQHKSEFEARLEVTIESLLENIVGAGRVKAQVTADLDFDRIVTNSEIFDPDGRVVRSVQTIEEREQSNDSRQRNNVTVANNLPNADAGGNNIVSTEDVTRTDETTNFEISRTTQNHVKETGTINKISVAVLVDGIYNIDEETGDVSYVPRSDEDLQRFRTLVTSAIGYDPSRGDKVEVINLRFQDGVDGFEKEGAYDWIKRELGDVLQTFIIGLVVILIIILIIRPMVNRAFEITKAEAEEAILQDVIDGIDPMEALAMDDQDEEIEEQVINDIQRVENKIKTGAVKTLNEVVDAHPQEALNILRNMMYEGKN
ncbi:MAG: flagellar M-ring protein FliF [Rickettsiales bacterium]|nr:flagellar M-ring protein FliF [Rickettsiales bacterium]